MHDAAVVIVIEFDGGVVRSRVRSFRRGTEALSADVSIRHVTGDLYLAVVTDHTEEREACYLALLDEAVVVRYPCGVRNVAARMPPRMRDYVRRRLDAGVWRGTGIWEFVEVAPCATLEACETPTTRSTPPSE